MTAMWAARAREMGMPTRKAQAMRRRRRRIHETAVDGAALTAAEIVWRGMEQLEERRSVFTARMLETLALGHSPGAFRLPALRAAVRGLVRGGHLVAAKKRRDPSFATDRIPPGREGHRGADARRFSARARRPSRKGPSTRALRRAG